MSGACGRNGTGFAMPAGCVKSIENAVQPSRRLTSSNVLNYYREMLTSVSEVVRELGGNGKVAERYGVKSSAVSNWRTWNRFPARLHYKISRDAAELGIEVAPTLFDDPGQSAGHADGQPKSAA